MSMKRGDARGTTHILVYALEMHYEPPLLIQFQVGEHRDRVLVKRSSSFLEGTSLGVRLGVSFEPKSIEIRGSAWTEC